VERFFRDTVQIEHLYDYDFYSFIHSYSFIENRNDRTHLHKYTLYKKNIKTVKTSLNVRRIL